jgi:hypothetical protein
MKDIIGYLEIAGFDLTSGIVLGHEVSDFRKVMKGHAYKNLMRDGASSSACNSTLPIVHVWMVK